MQYRIKLKNGRIIGPFGAKEIGELYSKGDIKGDEYYSPIPDGEWKILGEFPELIPLLQKGILGDEKEQTKVFFELKRFKIEEEEMKADTPLPLSEDEKNSQDFLQKLEEHKIPMNNTSSEIGDEEESRDSELGVKTTKFVRGGKKEDLDLEETVLRESVIRARAVVPPVEEKKVESEKKAEEPPPPPRVTSKDETVLIETKDIVPSQAAVAELDAEIVSLEQKAIIKKQEIEKENEKEMTKSAVILPSENEGTKLGKVKKMGPITAFAIIVIVYFLLYDEEVKPDKIVPVLPQISYPSLLQESNYKESRRYFEKGRELSKEYSYQSLLGAAEHFRRAYELYKDDKVLCYLLLTYADLYPHVVIMEAQSDLTQKYNKYSIRQKYGQVIIRLIKDLEIRRLTDLNVALGTALFYHYQGKHKAAINSLVKFQVGGGKIDNLRYYIVLLKILDASPLDDLAESIFQQLFVIKNRGLELTIVLTQHALKKGDYDTAKKLVEEGYKRFPQSVALLLEYGKILIYKESYKELAKMLEQVKKLNAEGSGLYYARYLEYMGMTAAFQKKLKEATMFFKLSLAIHESPQLLARLGDLESAENPITNRLIQESKMRNLIRQSEEAKEKNLWEKALLYAISAVDIEDTNTLDAKIYLASLQVARGYFNQAIGTLQKLHKEYPRIDDISFSLIQAYIDAFNFKEAIALLSNLYNKESINSPRYAFAMCYLNIRSRNYLAANMWLKKAIKLDPINDQLYYLYAQNLIIFKRFKGAMYQLIKAIDLDPGNVDYRILYAQILYNRNGVDDAIGYLNQILIESSDEFKKVASVPETEASSESTSNSEEKQKGVTIAQIIRGLSKMRREDTAKLISEMAIYYHFSGQFKIFEKYKEKLEKEFGGSETFYAFMAKVGKMEDRPQQFVAYSKKLLSVDPGNLEARISLGEFLIEDGKLDEAIPILEEMANRLDTYPKLYFYLSKIYLLKGDEEKSLILAQKEMDFNPNIEFGYLQAGEIYLRKKDYNKARNYYKLAQAKNSRSVDALLGMALMSAMEGHYEMALDLYLQASREDPHRAIIKRHLGFTYKALGQSSLAIQSFREYLEMKPDADDKEEIESTIRKL